MNREEFLKAYFEVLNRAIAFSEKARREGLLALEDECHSDKINKRDIFEYGMQFVIDGTDDSFIDKILSNIINHEKDELTRLLKTIQKEAVLSIQSGCNSRILILMMNSYTDLPLDSPDMKAILGD